MFEHSPLGERHLELVVNYYLSRCNGRRCRVGISSYSSFSLYGRAMWETDISPRTKAPDKSPPDRSSPETGTVGQNLPSEFPVCCKL